VEAITVAKAATGLAGVVGRGVASSKGHPAPSAHAHERVGILGGMFNPPHRGHLALAEAALSELGLDRVLLTPVLIPPHKPAEADPGAEHRLHMCTLATGSHPRVGVCTLELDRPGPSYTVDTLQSLHASDPDAEITLILGADMARTLGSWREPRTILELANIAVAPREGTSARAIADTLAPLANHSGVDFLKMAPLEVSSSMVRERVAARASIEDLVDSGVAGYIAEHKLYRAQLASAMGEPEA
jgi:nicotinate-nucleotide adenylyltransferase